jgi:hypothetical protein
MLGNSIVELRQYTLFPGTRDEFAELFCREFVTTQEEVGMKLIGQFLDLGDPNRFVWMRSFPDMESRKESLTSFYFHSKAWETHGESARTKMIDSTDALLLHPVENEYTHAVDVQEGFQSFNGIVIATIYYLPQAVDSDFLLFMDESVLPLLSQAGYRSISCYATEHSPNNFPRLPVRERENVFITCMTFNTLDAYHDHLVVLGNNPSWRQEIYSKLVSRLLIRPQILRLASIPTK